MLEGAKRIWELYDDDEFKPLLIQGDHGFGKSAYASRLIAEVYSRINNQKPFWNWNHFKRHMGFNPEEVLTEWERKRGRDYCYHWDDAGNWLHSLDFYDPFVKEVGKYMQLARTDWSCIIFSTISVDDITSKIRGLRNAIIIDITKEGSSVKEPFRRSARAYIIRKTFKGHTWRDYQWEDTFNCHVPDEFFKKYKPLRDHYAQQSRDRARQKLKEREFRDLEAKVRMSNSVRRLKKYAERDTNQDIDVQ